MALFTSIFLEMSVLDPDFGTIWQFDITGANDRVEHLSNLIALGKIWVKIVLAIKTTIKIDFGIEGEASTNGELNGFTIEAREHAGKAIVNWRNARIGFFAASVIIDLRKKLGLGG